MRLLQYNPAQMVNANETLNIHSVIQWSFLLISKSLEFFSIVAYAYKKNA